MTYYRIYLLDERGHVCEGRDCEVADDLAALEAATPLSIDRRIEVWQATRCVAKIQKGGGALPVDKVIVPPELRSASG
jgi:hypothetical protein